MKARTLLLVVLALPLVPACAKARNYLDPDGPRYVGGQGVPPEPRLGRRRVVTFNIEYALRVDRAIVALRDHPDLRGADVLTLQEMDAPGVEAIAKALGLNYAYYPAALHPQTHRDVGEAVLSPWPIERSWKLLLPHLSRVLGQGRAAVGADLRIGGKRVRVYSVHLGSPLGASPGVRREQAEMILADARSSPDPVIIAGDFNSHGIGALLRVPGLRLGHADGRPHHPPVLLRSRLRVRLPGGPASGRGGGQGRPGRERPPPGVGARGPGMSPGYFAATGPRGSAIPTTWPRVRNTMRPSEMAGVAIVDLVHRVRGQQLLARAPPSARRPRPSRSRSRSGRRRPPATPRTRPAGSPRRVW